MFRIRGGLNGLAIGACVAVIAFWVAACGSGPTKANGPLSQSSITLLSTDDTSLDMPSATDDTATAVATKPSLPDCAQFVGKPVKLILNAANPMHSPKCSISDYAGDPQKVFVERRAVCTDGSRVYAFFTVSGGEDAYIGAANGILRTESIGDESGDIHAACGKKAPPRGITYQVTTNGDGFSSITYFAASGEAQDTDVAGRSWSKNFPDGVQTPIVSAQGNGSGSYVACSILEDGQVTKSNKSSGPYAIVSCS
jgi:hypothetical protein